MLQNQDEMLRRGTVTRRYKGIADAFARVLREEGADHGEDLAAATKMTSTGGDASAHGHGAIVQVFHKHQSETTMSCKCTMEDDGILALHKFLEGERGYRGWQTAGEKKQHGRPQQPLERAAPVEKAAWRIICGDEAQLESFHCRSQIFFNLDGWC